eukprot:scaffold5430_cov78-Phaeocystis_antarctica.AAC.1
MVSCGCFPLPLPFLFRISQLRRNKLAQAFPIADILRVYTIHFLELSARTAYARVLLVQKNDYTTVFYICRARLLLLL